jgi:hypothetical protein
VSFIVTREGLKVCESAIISVKSKLHDLKKQNLNKPWVESGFGLDISFIEKVR